MNRSRHSLRPVLCLIAGLLAVLVISVHRSRVAEARIICSQATTLSNAGNCYVRTTNPPTVDIWAVGGFLQGGIPKTFNEVALDYTGSFLPTSTLGTQNLGSAALPWKTVYAQSNNLTAQTTTQLSVAVPTAVGQEVAFSAAGGIYGLCVSTGTGPGAYVYPSTTTAAGANPIVCK